VSSNRTRGCRYGRRPGISRTSGSRGWRSGHFGSARAPGGILELGETIAEGIARELFEETGLRVHALDLLDVYEKLLRDAGDRARYHFVILDYLCELQEGTARAGSDVTEVAWVREEDLKQFQLTGAAARVVRKAFAMARERSEAAHH
jgi:ADP-ribose pyrophosphatase YjhB (NUDIX family)